LDAAKTQLINKLNTLEGVILGNHPINELTPTVPATRLDAAIEDYLLQVVASNSGRTASSYRYTLEHFSKFLEKRGKRSVEELETADMVAYLGQMKTEGLRGSHSIQPATVGAFVPESSWPR
jgi:hypothetical protein